MRIKFDLNTRRARYTVCMNSVDCCEVYNNVSATNSEQRSTFLHKMFLFFWKSFIYSLDGAQLCLHSSNQCRNQIRRHGDVWGLVPKQSSKPPQIELWRTINRWSFCQISGCQDPWTKVKPPCRKLSGDDKILNQRIYSEKNAKKTTYWKTKQYTQYYTKI